MTPIVDAALARQNAVRVEIDLERIVLEHTHRRVAFDHAGARDARGDIERRRLPDHGEVHGERGRRTGVRRGDHLRSGGSVEPRERCASPVVEEAVNGDGPRGARRGERAGVVRCRGEANARGRGIAGVDGRGGVYARVEVCGRAVDKGSGAVFVLSLSLSLGSRGEIADSGDEAARCERSECGSHEEEPAHRHEHTAWIAR